MLIKQSVHRVLLFRDFLKAILHLNVKVLTILHIVIADVLETTIELNRIE